MSILENEEIRKAVSRIPLRSEKEQDKAKLVQSFVDTGVLVQLNNRNNQIFYGRRGTGKTHVLQVLSQTIKNEDENSIAVYIDLRTLGSNTQSEAGREPSHNAILLFKDILAEIHNELVARAVSDECEVTPRGYSALDELAEVSTQVASIRTVTGVVEREKRSSESTGTLGVEARLAPKPSLTGTAKAGDTSVTETEATTNYSVIERQHVIFNEVRRLLEQAIEGQGGEALYLLIDEWTAVPSDAQPFLAEYIKRGLLTSSRIVVKIASLEYRSDFSQRATKNNVLGFELGADISANLDLDDYCVYDRNPEAVIETFRRVLYRHIITELPDNYLADVLGILHQSQLTTALFSAPKTFSELVRAAEGVTRDFINIFNRSFFDTNRRNRDKIDVQAVTESARQWCEGDKLPQLDESQHRVLSRVMNQVIGEKKARSFMVERSEANHPIIQSLFDYRVIHLIHRGYADKTNPGVRYNIYTLDYGTYVDLLKTQKAPEMELFVLDDPQDDPDRVVPFDDKRSIRRIILTAAQLAEWTAS